MLNLDHAPQRNLRLTHTSCRGSSYAHDHSALLRASALLPTSISRSVMCVSLFLTRRLSGIVVKLRDDNLYIGIWSQCTTISRQYTSSLRSSEKGLPTLVDAARSLICIFNYTTASHAMHRHWYNVSTRATVYGTD
jgi:hypothetical protein